MSKEIEIALAIFFAFAGITLITVFAILQRKKPAPQKSRTSEKSPVLLSVLFVLYVVLAVSGFMGALIGIVLHPIFIFLGIVIGVVSDVLLIVLNNIIRSFDEKATEGQSSHTVSYQNQSSAYATQGNRPANDGERDYNYLEDVVDENLLIYSYEKDICLFEDGYMHLSNNGGKDLKFVQEPDNPYDSNAVAIYLEENKLGYVYRKDKTQKMINDWIRRGEYFTGYLNKFSVADKKATFKIGFYKPLSLFPSKTCSLVRTGKKIDDFDTRADNLRCCSEGDVVRIFESCEYPFSNTVCDDLGNELGELPKSAEKFLENCDVQDAIGIIREISDNYETAPKAKVEIYRIN